MDQSVQQSQTLCIKHLAKNYSKRWVVKDVSFTMQSGQIVGLLGPNGAGKTTSFYMVVGLVRMDKGEIHLDNLDLSDLAMHERARKGIGYLPQEASIFRDLSVYDNIFSIAELFHNKTNSIKVTSDLVKQFSLNNFQKTKGKLLSGGERRRTEIARALASNPKFLLLDEPFAGIDPIAIEEVKSTISLLKKMNIGVIITDHNVKEALSIVDYGYIIYNGEIIKSGNPKNIISDNFVKKIYLGKNYN